MAALLVFVALAASHAGANFAAVSGFSGRNGATCISCHTLAPAPFTPPEANAVLEGLPEGWMPGETYALTVRVEGGPDALPAPQPRGGFEMATSAGTFHIPVGFEEQLRIVEETEVTYRPAGTLLREWKVEWVAPNLAREPAPVHFWLAVLAANGNHLIASNTSDGGERFDAADHLSVAVPPSLAATTLWQALPLIAPEAAAARDASGWSVAGRHPDGNATHLAFRLDDGPWERRATGTSWRLLFPNLAGDHVVTVQSEGAGRASPETTVILDGPATVPFTQETPIHPVLPLAALLAATLFLQSRRIQP